MNRPGRTKWCHSTRRLGSIQLGPESLEAVFHCPSHCARGTFLAHVTEGRIVQLSMALGWLMRRWEAETLRHALRMHMASVGQKLVGSP